MVARQHLGRVRQNVTDARVIGFQDRQQLMSQPIAEKARVLVAAVSSRREAIVGAIGFDFGTRDRKQGTDQVETRRTRGHGDRTGVVDRLR